MTDGSRPRRPAGILGRGNPRRGDPPRRGVPPLPVAPETRRPELSCDLGPEWDAARAGRPSGTELPRRGVVEEGPPGRRIPVSPRLSELAAGAPRDARASGGLDGFDCLFDFFL